MRPAERSIGPLGGATPNPTQTAVLHGWNFDQLVREGLALIPSHAAEWTNHNPSDPGITLVELLAYFTEVLVYRIGRVPPPASLEFLRLLKGEDWPGAQELVGASSTRVSEAIDEAIADLEQQRQCAVTASDFERLASADARDELGGSEVRALCVPGMAVQLAPEQRRDTDMRGHVTVVLLPQEPLSDERIAQLCAAVHDRLAPWCLLTTRLHVVGPITLHADVGFSLALRPNADWPSVLEAIGARLGQHFGASPAASADAPMAAGGMALHLTDLVQVIDTTDGVDYVEDVAIVAMSQRLEDLRDSTSSLGIQIGLRSTIGVDSQLGIIDALDQRRLVRDDVGRLVSIALRPWEILRLHVSPGAVRPLVSTRGDDRA